MTCGIYQITNKVNGHCYIGSSLDVEKRFSEHLRALRRGKHHSRYFQRAFDKHGEKEFEFSVLSVCSPDELLTREQKFMDEQEPSYNVLPTAGSCLGAKWEEEAKEKHSKLFKLLGIRPPSRSGTTHTLSEDAKRRIGQSNTGKHHTLETKEKMRAAKLGKPGNRLGTKVSEETRAKISKANTGRYISEETRNKLSAATKTAWAKLNEEQEQ